MTITELYCVAERMHVEVDAFDLKNRDALSLMDDELCYIAINPFKLTSTAEEKTKLAHELGHCATGAFYNQYSTYDLRARHENSADKWAIKKLIPKDALDSAVSDGRTELWELAELFGVTEDFMRKAICLHKFGKLDSF